MGFWDTVKNVAKYAVPAAAAVTAGTYYGYNRVKNEEKARLNPAKQYVQRPFTEVNYQALHNSNQVRPSEPSTVWGAMSNLSNTISNYRKR